jgi:DNA-binding transcriptional LysR family regulator
VAQGDGSQPAMAGHTQSRIRDAHASARQCQPAVHDGPLRKHGGSTSKQVAANSCVRLRSWSMNRHAKSKGQSHNDECRRRLDKPSPLPPKAEVVSSNLRHFGTKLGTPKPAVFALVVCAAVCRRELERGELIRQLPEWGAGRVELNAVYASGRAAKPSARAFVDYLIATLPRD